MEVHDHRTIEYDQYHRCRTCSSRAGDAPDLLLLGPCMFTANADIPISGYRKICISKVDSSFITFHITHHTFDHERSSISDRKSLTSFKPSSLPPLGRHSQGARRAGIWAETWPPASPPAHSSHSAAPFY